MPSFALALPLKPGQEDLGKQFIEELTGSRSDHLHSQRQKHGFKRLQIFRQTKPTEMVIVYAETDDPHGSHSGRHADDHEFEAYFDEMVEKLTGHHLQRQIGPHPPSELLLDWHPEKGVSKTHHG
jgi:hypothetical protein